MKGWMEGEGCLIKKNLNGVLDVVTIIRQKNPIPFNWKDFSKIHFSKKGKTHKFPFNQLVQTNWVSICSRFFLIIKKLRIFSPFYFFFFEKIFKLYTVGRKKIF